MHIVESYTIAGRTYEIQLADERRTKPYTLWCGHDVIGTAVDRAEAERLIYHAAKVLLENELDTARALTNRAKVSLKLLGKSVKNLKHFQKRNPRG